MLKRKILLNIGAGPRRFLNELKLKDNEWLEVTYDTEEAYKPDILAKIEDISKHIEPNTIDIIVANHVIEHLNDWDVVYILKDLGECLTENGVLIIGVPNAIRICEEVVKTGSLRTTLFTAPSGSIRALDMLYGHQYYSQVYDTMRHKTAFTPKDLYEISKLAELELVNLDFEEDSVGFRMAFKRKKSE